MRVGGERVGEPVEGLRGRVAERADLPAPPPGHDEASVLTGRGLGEAGDAAPDANEPLRGEVML